MNILDLCFFGGFFFFIFIYERSKLDKLIAIIVWINLWVITGFAIYYFLTPFKTKDMNQAIFLMQCFWTACVMLIAICLNAIKII